MPAKQVASLRLPTEQISLIENLSVMSGFNLSKYVENHLNKDFMDQDDIKKQLLDTDTELEQLQEKKRQLHRALEISASAMPIFTLSPKEERFLSNIQRGIEEDGFELTALWKNYLVNYKREVTIYQFTKLIQQLDARMK